MCRIEGGKYSCRNAVRVFGTGRLFQRRRRWFLRGRLDRGMDGRPGGADSRGATRGTLSSRELNTPPLVAVLARLSDQLTGRFTVPGSGWPRPAPPRPTLLPPGSATAAAGPYRSAINLFYSPPVSS